MITKIFQKNIKVILPLFLRQYRCIATSRKIKIAPANLFQIPLETHTFDKPNQYSSHDYFQQFALEYQKAFKTEMNELCLSLQQKSLENNDKLLETHSQEFQEQLEIIFQKKMNEMFLTNKQTIELLKKEIKDMKQIIQKMIKED